MAAAAANSVSGKEEYRESSEEGSAIIKISFMPPRPLKDDGRRPLGIDDWTLIPRGTIVYQDYDRFGLAHGAVYLGQDITNPDILILGFVSICYDPEADEFIVSDGIPSLPTAACRCNFGQGYSECSCVANATIVDKVIAQFRNNRASNLSCNLHIIDLSELENHSTNGLYSWWDYASRDECKEIFSPSHSSFFKLCLRECQSKQDVGIDDTDTGNDDAESFQSGDDLMPEMEYVD